MAGERTVPRYYPECHLSHFKCEVFFSFITVFDLYFSQKTENGIHGRGALRLRGESVGRERFPRADSQSLVANGNWTRDNGDLPRSGSQHISAKVLDRNAISGIQP